MDSRLAPVASDPRSSHVYWKLWLFVFPSLTLYIPSLPTEMIRSPLREKSLKKVSTTHPPYERESYSFLERNLCSLFSFPLPLIYPLRGDLYSNTTYTHLECWECFWSLESIERCQGWWMQYGTYCRIRKTRKDMVRLNLVGAKSLEGLGTLDRLGLEGLLLFMYLNFIF